MKDARIAWKLFQTLDQLSTLIFEIYQDQILDLWAKEEEKYYSRLAEEKLRKHVDHLPDPF